MFIFKIRIEYLSQFDVFIHPCAQKARLTGGACVCVAPYPKKCIRFIRCHNYYLFNIMSDCSMNAFVAFIGPATVRESAMLNGFSASVRAHLKIPAIALHTWLVLPLNLCLYTFLNSYKKWLSSLNKRNGIRCAWMHRGCVYFSSFDKCCDRI